MTQSEFYGSIYSITENIHIVDFEDFDELNEYAQEITQEFQEIVNDIDEKMSNMSSYSGLESTPNYELLQERLDAVSEIVSELESFDANESDDIEDAKDNFEMIEFNL